MGLFSRRAGYPKIWKAAFCALLCFQAIFGTYYSWSEFKKGAHFNPFLSPSEFQEKVLKPAINADIPGGDIEAYLKAASSIALHGNYTLESGLPSAWVTPGYPMALALTFKLFGFHFWSVLLLNILAWGLAFLAVTKITQLLKFSNLETILALIFFAGNLRLSMFVGYAYTECLFIAFVTGFLVFYLRAIQSEKRLSILSALMMGLLAGYASLVRPVILGIAPLLLIVGPFIAKPSRALGWLLALVIALTPTAIWVYRNSSQLGYSVISTSSALARAEGAQDFYLSLPVFGVFNSAPSQKPYQNPTAGEYHAHPELNLFLAAQTWTKKWNQTHSLRDKIHLQLQRTLALFSPYIERMSPRNQNISLFYWLLIFPLTVIGIIRLRDSKAAWALFTSGTLLIFLPSLVVVSTSLRYQIPGQIILSILAAAGVRKK